MPSGLRERNAAATREGVLTAVVALLEDAPFERLTMPAIAEAAGISLRTLYRYYPDREALSLALGRWVDARVLGTGLPRTPGEVADQMAEIGPRFEEHVALVRALVGAPTEGERSPRRAERLDAIEAALAPHVKTLPSSEARRRVALVQLLASAPAWLQLRDEAGLGGDEAGAALAWAIRALLDETHHRPTTTTKEEKTMPVEVIHLLGDTIRVLAGADDSNGELTVVEVTTPPGGGPPLHTHTETEVFLALDGELELELDGAVRALRAGEAATAPSGTPHTYRNTSEAPARFVVAIVPGGFERFFAELAAATAEGPPDMVLVTEIAGRHGVRFVGAPAPA